MAERSAGEDDEFVGTRRRSKVEAYYHLVWATKGRHPALTPELERAVYRCLSESAGQMGCLLLAAGGMPDHVHVLLRAPGKYGPAELARLLKGPTSALVNQLRPEFSERFRWQAGYGCFTLGRNLVPRVTEYVRDQKRHHTDPSGAALWPEWEQTDEAAEVAVSPEQDNEPPLH